MEIFYVILGILLVLILFILLYLFSLKPNSKRMEALEPFENKYIAHRGYYDNSSDAPENSMAAFRKAKEMNFGIENDIQVTKDDKLIVFHDNTIKRMCGPDKKIAESTYEELLEYNLCGSKEKIPLFKDFIKEMDENTPLVIEIKPEKNAIRACEKLVEEIADFKGDYCVQSFDSRVLAWFRKNKPEVIRGQLSYRFNAGKKNKKKKNKNDHRFSRLAQFLVTNLMLDFYGKPDFISYNHKQKDQFSYKLARKLYKFKNAAWTIKTKEEMENAKDVFNIIIFDSFNPKE
ncbi:Glycerophosphoryl diester phosphodiesterase family protein [Lachnospiraceae bacterium RM5]|nr:Glycerophosphoryl diester phosphodiesterase family protein [Lachnospiraceae bacterium RM5]